MAGSEAAGSVHRLVHRLLVMRSAMVRAQAGQTSEVAVAAGMEVMEVIISEVPEAVPISAVYQVERLTPNI